jgi:hypothetical protein
MSERGKIWFVAAEDHRRFRQWCSEVRKHHNDRDIVLVTTDEDAMRRMSGLRWQEGDEVVILGNIWRCREGFYDRLRRMGCTEL